LRASIPERNVRFRPASAPRITPAGFNPIIEPVARLASSIVWIILPAIVAGCGSAPGAPSPPAPPALPAPPAAERPPIVHRVIQVCVVQNGSLVMVTVMYNFVTGDTVYPRNDWGVVPNGYAVNAPWFVHDEPITADGVRYVKFGPTRRFAPGELEYVGAHERVPLFGQAGTERPADVLFVPLRAECEFQPYARQTRASAVRG
jgi:hypothetical protein